MAQFLLHHLVVSYVSYLNLDFCQLYFVQSCPCLKIFPAVLQNGPFRSLVATLREPKKQQLDLLFLKQYIVTTIVNK